VTLGIQLFQKGGIPCRNQISFKEVSSPGSKEIIGKIIVATVSRNNVVIFLIVVCFKNKSSKIDKRAGRFLINLLFCFREPQISDEHSKLFPVQVCSPPTLFCMIHLGLIHFVMPANTECGRGTSIKVDELHPFGRETDVVEPNIHNARFRLCRAKSASLQPLLPHTRTHP